MPITHVRPWYDTAGSATPGHASGTVVLNNTTVPAGPGSMLVALVAYRPTAAAETPTYTLTDNLGGVWHQAKDSEGNPIIVGAGGTQSTKYAIFVRLNAGGVTSVSTNVSTPSGGYVISLVHEFAGGPTTGTPVWVALGEVLASATSWTGRTLTGVPEGSLVLAGASMGVTNRTMASVDPYTLGGTYKGSQTYNVAAWSTAGAGGTVTGPNYALQAGDSASSLSHLLAAIVGTEGVAALVVEAGADQTIFTNESATLTATTTGGEGGKTFLWTIQSGPAGPVLGNEDAAATTFDPDGTPGTYVLRCTVTDSTGSAYDEATITVSARPRVGITGASGWSTVTGAATPLAALTDDSLASYVETGPNPVNEVLTVDVPSLEAPTGTAFIMPVELSAVGNGGWITPQIAAGSGWVEGFPLYVVGAPDYYELTWPVAALGEVSWESGVQVRLVADFDDVL